MTLSVPPIEDRGGAEDRTYVVYIGESVEIVAFDQRAGDGGADVIDSRCLVVDVDILFRIRHFDQIPMCLETELSVISNLSFAFLSRFCGDQYDTVVGTRTVNGCRRCVFQYRDVFDIVGRKRVECVFYGNTVYDIERFVIGADRTDTAYTYRDSCARSTGSIGNLYTGDTSLHGLRGRSYRQFGDYFTVDFRHGAVDVAAFHRSITYYDYFVHQFGF